MSRKLSIIAAHIDGISSTVGFCFSSRLRVGEEVGRGAATFATLAGRNSYGVYLLSGLLSINGNKILIMSEMEMIVIRALFTSVSDWNVQLADGCWPKTILSWLFRVCNQVIENASSRYWYLRSTTSDSIVDVDECPSSLICKNCWLPGYNNLEKGTVTFFSFKI